MEKTICKCPNCSEGLVEGRFAYECICGFKCFKSIWGVDISEDLLKDICSGKTTDKFTFKKPDKEWSARLKYSKEDNKVVFEFDAKNKKSEVFAKCPCCGSNVKETDKYYICEEYKKSCNLIIGKEINGTTITKEDAIKLLKGETLSAREFTWKSGKKSLAKLRLNKDRTEFVF